MSNNMKLDREKSKFKIHSLYFVKHFYRRYDGYGMTNAQFLELLIQSIQLEDLWKIPRVLTDTSRVALRG